jgi:hypothetical protein
MKKTIKTLGKIALVLIIAFSFASCFNILDDLFKDDSKDGGGGGGGGGGSGSGLTITGLPSGQWNVFVFTAGTDVSSLNYNTVMGIGNKREAGNYGSTVDGFCPLFRISSEGPSPNTFWTGSGSRAVAIFQNSDPTNHKAAMVSFSNGNATVPYSSFK